MPKCLEVMEVIEVSARTYIMKAKPVISNKPINFLPGQFLTFLLHKDGKLLRKQYSIASPPSNKDCVEFVIRIVEGGFASNYLHKLKKGDRIEYDGPSGLFVLKYPLADVTVFVATGTGVGPFRSIISTIFEEGTDKDVWLFYGVRSEDELAYHDEFKVIADLHENFHYIPIVSRSGGSWDGETGHIQEHLKEKISDGKGKDIYLCGVLQMITETQALALQMGFEKSRIHKEIYV